MLYKGQFKSISGTLFEVRFITDNDTATETQLLLADDPVHIELNPENDSVFTPVQLKSATVSLVLTEPYFDLYSPTKDDVQVQINDLTNDKLLFRGFVLPNIYNQTYSKFYDTLEISCTETVTNLKYIEYQPVGVSREIVSLKSVIDKCMQYSLISVYHVADSYRVTDSLLDELYIDENNFYEDDAENTPLKYDEVLKEICKFCGLTFYTEEDEGWFVDKELLLYPNLESYHTYTVGADSYQTTSPDIHTVDISIGDWTETGTALELDETYNKIIVTSNTYPIDEDLKDIFDDNFQNQYVVNQVVPNDSGEPPEHKYQHVYARVAPFTGQSYKCYFYSPNTYLSMMPNAYGKWYIDTDDAITPTIPDSAHRNGELQLYDPLNPGPYPGDDITDIGAKVIKESSIEWLDNPTQLNFTNEIWFSLGIGYQNKIDSTTYSSSVWNANFFKESFFPVFVYRSDLLVKFQPDVRSYILIKGSLRDIWSEEEKSQYSAYPHSGLKTEKLYDASEHDNEKAHYIRVPYKLKIGNKVYLGYDTEHTMAEPVWGAESSWDGSTYIEVYESNINHNSAYQIFSNVIYQSGIAEAGHGIYISQGVQGKIELTLYRPYFYGLVYSDDQVPRWVVFEDFQVKFIQVDRNFNYLEDETKDEADTEYANEINGEFVNEESELELKINTQNPGKKTSLSSVMYDNNGDMQFVTDMYSVINDERNIQENNLVQKLHGHYSVQKRIITGALNRIYRPDELLNWRGFSNMTVQSQDMSLHYDRNNVKIIEI